MEIARKQFPVSRAKLTDAVQRVVANLGWKASTVTEKAMSLDVPGGLLSWGETVTLSLDDSGQGTVDLTVSSDAKAQLFTWGKNDENIEKLLAGIEKELE
jgi:hypothetical protein